MVVFVECIMLIRYYLLITVLSVSKFIDNEYGRTDIRDSLCLSGAVISTSDYESAGPSSIPDEGRRNTAHPAVHPPKRIDR